MPVSRISMTSYNISASTLTSHHSSNTFKMYQYFKKSAQATTVPNVPGQSEKSLMCSWGLPVQKTEKSRRVESLISSANFLLWIQFCSCPGNIMHYGSICDSDIDFVLICHCFWVIVFVFVFNFYFSPTLLQEIHFLKGTIIKWYIVIRFVIFWKRQSKLIIPASPSSIFLPELFYHHCVAMNDK